MSSTNPTSAMGESSQSLAPSDSLAGLRNIARGNRFLRPLRSLVDIFYLAARRLYYHVGLSLLSLFGIILALGLVSSAAFFSQAVDTVMMRQELADYTKASGRPPFSSLVFAPSTRSVPLTLARGEELGNHVADTLSSEIGWPVRFALIR